MRACILLLACLAHTTSQRVGGYEGQAKPENALASLLLSMNPEAGLPSSLPTVNGQLSTPLKIDAKGVPLTVPLSFSGGKISSGLEFEIAGVKVVIPFAFLAKSLAALRPEHVKKVVDPSNLKVAKGSLKTPLKLDVNGKPVSIPVAYASGKITYPLKFKFAGFDFTVPLGFSIQKKDLRTLADFVVTDAAGKEVNLSKYSGKLVIISSTPCAELAALQAKYPLAVQVVVVPDKSSPIFSWIKGKMKLFPFLRKSDKYLFDKSGKLISRSADADMVAALL